MKILKDIATLKKHVTVNFNFNWTIIQPYVRQAERKYIVPVIGKEMYDAYDGTPIAGIPLEVLELLQEAVANFAMFKYVPIGSVNISNNGMTVSQGEHHKNAEWYQYRDVQRTLLSFGHEAIDAALAIMETNKTQFPKWTTSENYTVFNELYTNHTEAFERFYSIGGSRRVFLALRPFLLEVQHQYLGWLDDNTKAQIISAGTTVTKTALEYARAAQVNFALANAMESGIFLITAEGLFLRITEIKGDKTQAVSIEEKNKMRTARTNAGNEFVLKLKNHIEANLATFTGYTVKEAATGSASLGIEDTKSIVSF